MLNRSRKARELAEEVGADYESVAPRREPSLARQTAIAALDPKTGKLWNNSDFTIAAAVLAELAHLGRLDVSGTGKKLEVTLRDPSPVGDHVLDDAMLTIGAGTLGQKLSRIVPLFDPGREVLRRLAAEGVLSQESSRTLGVFPSTRYRPLPLAGRDDLLARLRAVLLDGAEPDDRTALLVAALSVGVHPKLWVPRNRVDEARARRNEIRESLGADERELINGVRELLSDKLDRAH